MSFLNFTGPDNIILNSDPKISLFTNRLREYDIYNIDKAEKQNQLLPYINFDLEKKIFYPNDNNQIPVISHEFNLDNLLLKHDMLGGIIVMINKYGSLDNTLNNIKLFKLQIDEAVFSFNIVQLKIYDKFVEKIFFDVSNVILIKLPCRFFKESRNYIPIFPTLKIKLIVEFKILIVVGIECTVINLDETESKKIKLYFGHVFEMVTDYQEFISQSISLNNRTFDLSTIKYPIKEIFWYYSLNENPSVKCKACTSVDIIMEDSTNYLREIKNYSQIQCTGTNPITYHNTFDPDIYMCSFCLEPNRQHPTGHFLSNGFDCKMSHNISMEYAKHNLILNMIFYEFVLIRFYKDRDNNVVKCKLLKIYELGKNKIIL